MKKHIIHHTKKQHFAGWITYIKLYLQGRKAISSLSFWAREYITITFILQVMFKPFLYPFAIVRTVSGHYYSNPQVKTTEADLSNLTAISVIKFLKIPIFYKQSMVTLQDIEQI